MFSLFLLDNSVFDKYTIKQQIMSYIIMTLISDIWPSWCRNYHHT